MITETRKNETRKKNVSIYIIKVESPVLVTFF